MNNTTEQILQKFRKRFTQVNGNIILSYPEVRELEQFIRVALERSYAEGYKQCGKVNLIHYLGKKKSEELKANKPGKDINVPTKDMSNKPAHKEGYAGKSEESMHMSKKEECSCCCHHYMYKPCKPEDHVTCKHCQEG